MADNTQVETMNVESTKSLMRKEVRFALVLVAVVVAVWAAWDSHHDMSTFYKSPTTNHYMFMHALITLLGAALIDAVLLCGAKVLTSRRS